MSDRSEKRSSLALEVDALDDFDAVEVVKHLHELLAATPEVLEPADGWETNPGFDEVASGSLRGVSEPLDWEQPIAVDLAQDVARHVLATAIEDPRMSRLVIQAQERHASDRRLAALEILAAGVAVSLIITVATCSVEWRDGKLVKIRKSALDSATIRAFVDLLDRIVAKT